MTSVSTMHESDGMLEERERQSSIILGSMAYAVIVANEGGFVTFMNPFAERLTGWQGKDACGRPLTEVVSVTPGEAAVPFHGTMMNALHGQRIDGPADRRVTFIDRAGQEVDIEYRATPLGDDDGHIPGVVLAFRDVTLSGSANTRLSEVIAEHLERSQLTTTLFNSMAEGVVVAGADRKLAFVNPSAERLTGVRVTDCTPGKWLDTHGGFHADGQTPLKENDLPNRARTARRIGERGRGPRTQ